MVIFSATCEANGTNDPFAPNQKETDMWKVEKIERWVVIDPEDSARIIHPTTREAAQFLTVETAQAAADKLNDWEG